MVCVRKRNKTMRLCIDYRELNKENLLEKIPLPRIKDIIDNLGGQKYFTKFDMSKAYHQGLDETSRHCTAFTSSWGLYELVMYPFWTLQPTSSLSTFYE